MTNLNPDEAIFDTHPSLGAYLAHHPSRRLWLLLRGALFYAVPVGFVQLLTLDVEAPAAQFILPALYAVIGLVVVWYVAHFWNREIVLYSAGFTYREGSHIGDIRYADVIRVREESEQINLFGRFPWIRYRYMMYTRYDEILRVTNLYAETRKLIDTLNKRITQAQIESARVQLAAGDMLDFGAGLRLSREGLLREDGELLWHEFQGYRVRNARLWIETQGDAWAEYPVRELDNIVLLLALLKEQKPDMSATENTNAS